MHPITGLQANTDGDLRDRAPGKSALTNRMGGARDVGDRADEAEVVT